MSASRERKMRNQQAAEIPAEQPKKKKKLSEGWVLFISVVLVLAIVFGSVLVYQGYWADRTVMQVGDHVVQPAQFNFFYRTQYNNLSSYLTYLGIDSSTSLKEQKVTSSGAAMLTLLGMDTSFLPELADGVKEYDISWAEFFSESAARSAALFYAIYDKAIEHGFKLDEDTVEEIDTEIDNLGVIATLYSMSADEYIENIYGKGCTAEGYREYLTIAQFYNEFPNHVRDEYSDEEAKAVYDEKPEDYDCVSFWLYTVKASDFATKSDDSKTAPITDENRESAKKAAEKMLEEFNTEDEKMAFYADYLYERVESLTNEEVAYWLFKTASLDGESIRVFLKPEEKTEKDDESKDADEESDDEADTTTDDTYYVVKLVSNQPYNTAKLLQIFVKADSTSSSSSTTATNSKTEAERVLELLDSLKEDDSREAFEKLANSDKSDVSGEYAIENVTHSSLSSYEEMLAWVFSAERKEGDWQKFDTDDGTYILFYDGAGQTNRDLACRNALVTEWLDKLAEEAFENCNYNPEVALHAEVA